jgi:D-alanyl-D-alanine carboxypeptidase/D-alanyl-D-alanine-endopeptidase (penicillin-binding protein 4)
MRSLALFITIWILTCLCGLSVAQARTTSTGNADALTAEINRALFKVNPNARVGITIKSMKYGDIIYSKNAETFFVPASTLKIFTAEAGLLFLGPDFKFTTRFVTDAKAVSNGVLYGNVYLINSGDPSLTYYDIADLVLALKSQGIRTITGNVYIDNTAYDQVTIGPGWLWHDRKFCYAAPISASIINHNCLSFRMTPAKSKGATANVITDPRMYYAGISNDVVTKSYTAKSCYIRLNGAPGGAISVSGCIPKGRYGAGISTVIDDVLQYNKSLLKTLFRYANIQINGTITAGVAAPRATELARHESKPLQQLISEMLKKSDNIIASSLFKKIGELYYRRPGSWENGGQSVSRILSQRAGVNTWHMNLVDGSGLSRFNLVSPAQMLQLLNFAYHDPTNYDFISALPVAGIDGTLKHRMKNISWKVRAKTGTMSGVVSLAGYAINADKEPFAFVIMINGHNGSIWQYRELEDRVLTVLTHYSRNA